MNKRQLLQQYANLYENSKISRSRLNKLVWQLKQLDKLEKLNQEYILNRLSKIAHVISVKTKTRANNDYNNQLKAIKNQCGYTYDLFNFVTLNRQGKKQMGRVSKPKAKQGKPAVKVIKDKKQASPKTLQQAFKDCIKLETLRQASK